MIEIQHGCEKVPTQESGYVYVDVSVKGYNKDYQSIIDVESTTTRYPFIAMFGQVPEIGDFIDSGVLVKRTVPKVNNDWSRWKDKEL